MRNGLHRPGLAIPLDADLAPWDANILYGPKDIPHPFVRIFVHEVLHFWQTLSQGFFARQALAEWRQVLRFEVSGGRDLNLTDELRERNDRLYRQDETWGISAWSLSEALCRFWDMHIMGPERLIDDAPELRHLRPQVEAMGLFRETPQGREYSGRVFDLVLTIQDSYAAPYRLSLERLGTGKSVHYFPLVAHFALQSPDPARVFARAIRRLEDAPELPPEFVINTQWLADLEQVEAVCAAVCAELCDGAALESGWDVVRSTELGRNPVYAHYAAIVQMVEGMPWYRKGRCFALPGNPDTRRDLTNAFLPPLVLFNDGRWAEPSVLHLQGKLVALSFAMRPDPPFSLDGMREIGELAEVSEHLLALQRRLDKARTLKRLQARALAATG